MRSTVIALSSCLTLGFPLTSSFKYVDHHHPSSLYAIAQDTNNLFSGISRVLDISTRPAYIRCTRKYINLPFAIQLMRSSYNAVDELNCYPMDRFQKDFFLFRQNEWEIYKEAYPSIMQGNLADPYYFDFISFAQYATISNTFQHAMTDFIEKEGAEGTSRVIRRNDSIPNNAVLPDLHSKLVGQKLFK